MTASPEDLADRPVTPADLSQAPQDFADPPTHENAALGLGSHDLLSALLHSVRLSGERIVAYAPPPTFSVGFADIGSLHIIEEGELVLRIDGDRRVEHLRRGDAVLAPRGDTHHINGAGTDNPARWLCGTFTIGDPQASHLLGSLPAAIVLRGASGPAMEGLEVARRMLVF